MYLSFFIGLLCFWTIIFIMASDIVLSWLSELNNPFKVMGASYWVCHDQLEALDDGWGEPEKDIPADMATVFSIHHTVAQIDKDYTDKKKEMNNRELLGMPIDSDWHEDWKVYRNHNRKVS